MSERLNYLLDRYGEICTQTRAAAILGISTQTIYRMLSDGRLRRVAKSVDVRSIDEYIEREEAKARAKMEAKAEARMNRRCRNPYISKDGQIDFRAASMQTGRAE